VAPKRSKIILDGASRIASVAGIAVNEKNTACDAKIRGPWQKMRNGIAFILFCPSNFAGPSPA